MLYSVIIPVYNRPDEIDELLASLTRQTVSDFEVLIIEDGSDNRCDDVVKLYNNRLNIRYFYKENSGQGFSRNFGFKHAKGDYLVVFDSDCIIPPRYFEAVQGFMTLNKVDCWGGPDIAHPSFTPVQKAINFSMTSFITTGGIRGRKKHLGTYHPRSFNMGISREVLEKTGGYTITRMGEDLDFSIRIIQAGFQTAFIEEAYVYHKRRTSLLQFYKQLHFFGRARVNINQKYPEQVRIFHFFPVLFTIGAIIFTILAFTSFSIFNLIWILFPLYAFLLFGLALSSEKKANVAALATVAGFIQLFAYGIGFLSETWNRISEKT